MQIKYPIRKYYVDVLAEFNIVRIHKSMVQISAVAIVMAAGIECCL